MLLYLNKSYVILQLRTSNYILCDFLDEVFILQLKKICDCYIFIVIIVNRDYSLKTAFMKYQWKYVGLSLVDKQKPYPP